MRGRSEDGQTRRVGYGQAGASRRGHGSLGRALRWKDSVAGPCRPGGRSRARGANRGGLGARGYRDGLHGYCRGPHR